MDNLADDLKYQKRIKKMAKRLDGWMTKQGDPKTVFEEPYHKSKPEPKKEDFPQQKKKTKKK